MGELAVTAVRESLMDDAVASVGSRAAVRGRFISFEGGEGTGKSTQAKSLKRKLEKLDLDVVLTREPGGSPAAELIRRLLLLGTADPFGPDCETALFYAARADHLDTLIRPALDRGAWVVTDRFSDSTRAYQAAGDTITLPFIERLDRAIVGRDAPDLTLILDLDPEIGLARARAQTSAAGEGDAFEDRELAYHKSVRDAFLDIAADHPDRCVVIDASRSKRSVQTAIWKAVNAKFGDHLATQAEAQEPA
ncbi:MAG: dTMP kinase [Pseudomonadota bacterium]